MEPKSKAFKCLLRARVQAEMEKNAPVTETLAMFRAMFQNQVAADRASNDASMSQEAEYVSSVAANTTIIM